MFSGVVVALSPEVDAHRHRLGRGSLMCHVNARKHCLCLGHLRALCFFVEGPRRKLGKVMDERRDVAVDGMTRGCMVGTWEWGDRASNGTLFHIEKLLPLWTFQDELEGSLFGYFEM
jgi:hypothetical protein